MGLTVRFHPPRSGWPAMQAERCNGHLDAWQAAPAVVLGDARCVRFCYCWQQVAGQPGRPRPHTVRVAPPRAWAQEEVRCASEPVLALIMPQNSASAWRARVENTRLAAVRDI